MRVNDPERRREYNRRYYAKNKEHQAVRVQANTKRYMDAAYTWIARYLDEHPCVDCGEDDKVVLEFDHVRGVKVTSVSSMCRGGYSIEKLVAEVEKCEVRCANCHRRKTALELGWRRYDI